MFVEKSYVIASILNVKYKYFKEEFVTYSELNEICWAVQEKLNEENINTCITSEVSECFLLKDNIVINEELKMSLPNVVKMYMGYLPLDVALVIWDEELILNKLIEIRERELKRKLAELETIKLKRTKK